MGLNRFNGANLTLNSSHICQMRLRSAGLLRRHKRNSIMHRYHCLQRKKLNTYKVKWHERIGKYLKLKGKKRLASIKRNRMVKQMRGIEIAVICKELSNERSPHSHSHLYLKTKNHKSFRSMKRFCQKQLRTRVNDIQRPLNVRETVRYITKTDLRAVVFNVQTKFCSTVWRAHLDGSNVRHSRKRYLFYPINTS